MSIKQLPSGIEVRIRQDLSEGSRGDTTLIIDPIITKAGYRVTMDDIGVRGFGKIDANNPREEIISWTGITDNGTTYTLTGVVWGINFHNSTGNFTDNMKRHISGAKFSINTDMHYIADNYVNKRDFDVSDNSIGWGDGTKDENKVLEARNGTANLPFIVYNETVNKWLISNDGINTYDILAGDSGLEAGVATLINAGKIDVQVGDASGVQIVDNKINIVYQTNPGLEVNTSNELGVKIKEDTGLIKDADGLWCDSIDPDNPVAQSPAKLIGGDDVVLQNFIDLGAGANNGKFTANIDGVEYDDIFVSSRIHRGDDFSSDLSKWTITEGGSDYFSIISGKLHVIDMDDNKDCRIELNTTFSPNLKYTFEWNNVYLPSGSSIYCSYIFGLSSFYFKYSARTQIISIWENNQDVQRISMDYNSTHSFKIEFLGDGKALFYIDGSLVRTGTYTASTTQTLFISIERNNAMSSDLTFEEVVAYRTVISCDEIATLLRTAIRTATSKLETVVWDTDHFEITSTISGKNNGSQVLKLQPPTTGTDISGAGYLDLGENATEVACDGDDYKLVRLDEDGQVPLNILTKFISTPFPEGYDIMFYDPQKYSTDSSSFVKQFSLKFNRTGNYRIKCWAWGTNSGGYLQLKNGESVLFSGNFPGESGSTEPLTSSTPFLNDLFIIQAGTIIDIYLRRGSYGTACLKDFTVQASHFTTPTIERIDIT